MTIFGHTTFRGRVQGLPFGFQQAPPLRLIVLKGNHGLRTPDRLPSERLWATACSDTGLKPRDLDVYCKLEETQK